MIESSAFYKRALAHVIDITIITILVTVPMEMYFESNSVSVLERTFFESASQIFLLIVTIFMWLKYQGTPGKKVMKIKVVDNEGNPLMPMHAVGRYFAYFLSIIPLFAGFAWSFVDKEKRCFHDIVSKSKVIDE